MAASSSKDLRYDRSLEIISALNQKEPAANAEEIYNVLMLIEFPAKDSDLSFFLMGQCKDAFRTLCSYRKKQEARDFCHRLQSHQDPVMKNIVFEVLREENILFVTEPEIEQALFNLKKIIKKFQSENENFNTVNTKITNRALLRKLNAAFNVDDCFYSVELYDAIQKIMRPTIQGGYIDRKPNPHHHYQALAIREELNGWLKTDYDPLQLPLKSKREYKHGS